MGGAADGKIDEAADKLKKKMNKKDDSAGSG
jgi:hypothetical protein